jgi:DNA polymerase-4
VLKGMIDDLMARIRADGQRVRTLTIKVRYPDFTHASAGRSLPRSTDLETGFYPLVEPLLRQAWTKRRPLRLVSANSSIAGRSLASSRWGHVVVSLQRGYGIA